MFVSSVSVAQTLSGVMSADETWDLAGSPYILAGNVTVNSGVTLTIEPGVQVLFSANDLLLIQGVLDAQGMAGDSIRFSGETTFDGRLELGAGSTATIDYAVFNDMANGGTQAALTINTVGAVSIDNSRFVDNQNAIFVIQAGAVSITNSLIDRSTNKGIRLDQPATIQNTTFSNNGSNGDDSGIHINAPVVPTLDNNTFTNNFIDVLTHPEITDDQIFDTNGLSEIVLAFENITTNTTWHQPVLPESWNFRMFNNVIVDPAVTLTIEPGVEVIFAAGSDLSIDGTLNAVGTMADSIRFTGINTYDGEVILSAGSTADIDYVVFSDMADNAGNAALTVATTGTVDVANSRFARNNNGILIVSGASPTIANITIENSLRNGINVNGGSSMTLTNSLIDDSGDKGIRLLSAATIQNTSFTDNGFNGEDCGLHIDAAIVPTLDNNTFSGNAIDLITHPEITDDEIFDTNGLTLIFVDDKSITTNTTWQRPVPPEDWDYRILPDVTVEAGVTLTIEAGVEVIMFNGDLLVDGNLDLTGNVTDSIRFTGSSAFNSEVWLRSGSTATIDYVVFDNLKGSSANPALTVSSSLGISINNSRFVRNTSGIRLEDGGDLTIDNTTIEANDRQGIFAIDGTMTLTNSLIEGNQTGIEVVTPNVTIQDNVFNNNGNFSAVYISQPITPVLENNVFTNNTRDVVTHPEITSEAIFDTNGLTEIHIEGTFITADATWEKPALPEDWEYTMLGDVIVEPGVTLTIEPGTIVNFGVNMELDVSGTLNAIGAVNDSIRFIGQTISDGVVLLRDGSDASFDYVVFRNMGDDAFFAEQHALVVQTTGTVTVDNSRFFENINGIKISLGGTATVSNTLFDANRMSAVRVEEGDILIDNAVFFDNLNDAVLLADTATIQNSTFMDNGSNDAAIHIQQAIVPTLENNTFSGNFYDVLTHPEILDDEIFDGNGLTEIYIDGQNITSNTVWSAPPASEPWIYRMISEVTVEPAANLTIEPGVTVYLDADLRIEGAMDAIGLVSNTIKFIGQTAFQGGVDFLPGSTGTIQFVLFEDLGESATEREHALYLNSSSVNVNNALFFNNRGGIRVSNGATPTITTVTLRNNQRFGVFVDDGTPLITDSRIEANDVGIGILSGSATINASCIFDNISFGIDNSGGMSVDATNNWWGDPTGPRNDATAPAALGDLVSDDVDFASFNTVECSVVQSPPTINFDLQPVSANGCEGESASFFLEASGDTGLTYQWQEDQGTGFVDLVNGTNYSGVNTDMLEISNLSIAFDGFRYRCLVSGDVAEPQFSGSRFLSVLNLPADPVLTFADTSLCGPGAIDLLASGVSEGVYRWWESATSTTPLLADDTGVFSPGTVSSTTTFYVSILESCETPRFPILVTIATLPTISAQPTDRSSAVGEDVDLTVTADGGGLSYQWQKDGVDIAAGTSATLSLTNLTLADAGDYTCIVTNACGTITSDAAVLTVVSDPIPEFTLSILEGATPVEVTGTVDIGQTEVSVDLTRDFEIENTGVVTISVISIVSDNSNFSVINVPASVAPAATESFSIVYNSSVVTTDAANLTISFVDSVFTVSLTAESTPPLPVITVDISPVDASICEGEDATFNLTASGDFGLAYQWQENQGSGFSDLTDSGIYSGVATNTLLLTNPPATNDGFEYRCVISGFTALDVISDTTSLTINTAPVITSQPADINGNVGTDATFSVTASGSNLTYQWQKDGVDVPSETASSLSLLNLNLADAGDYSCIISNPCGTVTSQDATLTVSDSPLPEFTLSILEDATLIEVSGVPDLGQTAILTDLRREFVIENRGGSVINIIDILSSNSNFTVENIPSVIDVASSGTFEVVFNSATTGQESTTVTIQFQEGDFTFQVIAEAITSQGGVTLSIFDEDDDIQIFIGERVDLGETEVLVDLTTQFLIENGGSQPIVNIDITSSSTNFTVVNIPTQVDAQSFDTFDLIFNRANPGRDSTDLRIDLQDTIVNVRVLAEAFSDEGVIFSVIEDNQQVAVGSSVDLGQTEVRVDLSSDFVIENGGSEPIVIIDITSSNPNFVVTNIPDQIEPMSSETFNVTFNRSQQGRDSTTLRITTQDTEYTIEVFAEATQELSNLIIYNAVAPNGDGKHDWFKIENIEQYPDNTVEIFNRWGDRVFETVNYDNDDPNRRFEGTRNIGSADGDLVEGTYFYLIDLKNNSNPQSGYLLLKR